MAQNRTEPSGAPWPESEACRCVTLWMGMPEVNFHPRITQLGAADQESMGILLDHAASQTGRKGFGCPSRGDATEFEFDANLACVVLASLCERCLFKGRDGRADHERLKRFAPRLVPPYVVAQHRGYPLIDGRDPSREWLQAGVLRSGASSSVPMRREVARSTLCVSLSDLTALFVPTRA